MTQVSQNEVKNDDVTKGTVVISETSNACPSTPDCPIVKPQHKQSNPRLMTPILYYLIRQYRVGDIYSRC